MNRIKLNTSNESTVLMRNSNGNQTGTPSKRRGGNEAGDPHPLLNKNFEDGLVLIEKWLRNKNTIEFIGIWEQLNNPDFNSPEFEGIRNEVDKIAGKKPEQVER